MARKPSDLMAAISEALAIDGPAIVDATVAADEMPNMPHVELAQVGQYAVAKIKEAVLAVTGGLRTHSKLDSDRREFGHSASASRFF
jgi:hypothetical protein